MPDQCDGVLDHPTSSGVATVAIVVVKGVRAGSPKRWEERVFNNNGSDVSEGGRRFRWGECPHEPLGSSKIQVSRPVGCFKLETENFELRHGYPIP
jgi:hypothetical protein